MLGGLDARRLGPISLWCALGCPETGTMRASDDGGAAINLTPKVIVKAPTQQPSSEPRRVGTRIQQCGSAE